MIYEIILISGILLSVYNLYSLYRIFNGKYTFPSVGIWSVIWLFLLSTFYPAGFHTFSIAAFVFGCIYLLLIKLLTRKIRKENNGTA